LTVAENPARDNLLDQGPADPFDLAVRIGALGQRMAIDATRKRDSEWQYNCNLFIAGECRHRVGG